MQGKYTLHGLFFCWKCGGRLAGKSKTCPHCGAASTIEDDPQAAALPGGGVGWSKDAAHPCFRGYARKYGQVSLVWLIGLSLLVPGALLLSGQVKLDREGILVLVIVVAIFGLSALIFLTYTFGRNQPDWDGRVVDKMIHLRERSKKVNGRKKKELYKEYAIKVRRDDGSERVLLWEDNTTHFDYYQIGDLIRYHGNRYLHCYEKYDKSNDDVIFCAACKGMNDARSTYCSACGCILLKGEKLVERQSE